MCRARLRRGVVLTTTEEMSAMYNPVDVDLMRLETQRRREELAPLARRTTAADRRGRRDRRERRLPVLPGRLGPVLAVLLHREPAPRHRPV